MPIDKIYGHNLENVPPFTFNEEVAKVFDNMISRSVPLYYELEELIANFAIHYYQKNTNIYDLGCSTGETLVQISRKSTTRINLIGVDSSKAMVSKAKIKCKAYKNIALKVADIRETDLENASVVIITYVLQFLPVADRLSLLKEIFESTVPNGVALISEKISFADNNQDFVALHEQFKKNNKYSDLEIKQKREALENVLITRTQAQNILMIKEAGFRIVEPFFQCLNFCSFLAIK
ncbi:MAG: carboxy-S-adenosyl-L-methionine synthase CmoA [Candidatus Margulisbacteria bacterium GWF2_35_9]|nr:MAG: carboxy-S-adenosyl-L-methionine synthase CmoA [Candidatus Margulisbacteria bacterium GWF2_35_9]